MTATLIAALAGKGVLLGLGAAVPIGPVNVEIARRTLRQGFRFGVAFGAGASSVDVAYAVLSSIGWAPLIGRRGWMTVLGIAGAVFLLYLAALCLRGAYQTLAADGGRRLDEADAAPADASGPGVAATYLTGLLMNALNPMILLFWFVVLPGTAAKLTESPRRDLPWLCLGVFAGTIGWVLSFAGAMSLLGRFRRGRWIAIADALGGLVLLGFAVALVWKTVRM